MKKKKNKAQKDIPKLDSLKQINLDAGGIDIGSTEIWVCVPEDRDEKSVKKFGTFTTDLHAIALWLKKCSVTTVAMESTGIYWIPLYDILDSQWLQQLQTYGLLRASFIPEKDIRRLRDLGRHRENLIRYRAAHIQHMQKILHKMNLQLDNVISDITGKTGMKIIRAIVAGQWDPRILARYRDPNCKNSQEVIQKSLEGHYNDEHVFELKQVLDLYDYYTEKIKECDLMIQKQFGRFHPKVDLAEKPLPVSKKLNSRCKNEPAFDLRADLYCIAGVDLTAIDGLNASTVYTIISEIGVDISKWATEKHFSSWLCLCPNNKKSGGKILSTRTRKTANRANKALRQAAQSLHRSKSYLGAYYRRMRTRLGAAEAITATAHKIARIIYIMLKEQREFIDFGEDYYLEKNRKREIKKLIKKAAALGFYLNPAGSVS